LESSDGHGESVRQDAATRDKQFQTIAAALKEYLQRERQR